MTFFPFNWSFESTNTHTRGIFHFTANNHHNSSYSFLRWRRMVVFSTCEVRPPENQINQFPTQTLITNKFSRLQHLPSLNTNPASGGKLSILSGKTARGKMAKVQQTLALVLTLHYTWTASLPFATCGSRFLCPKRSTECFEHYWLWKFAAETILWIKWFSHRWLFFGARSRTNTNSKRVTFPSLARCAFTHIRTLQSRYTVCLKPLFSLIKSWA